MSILSGTCEICYQEINENENRKFCNNCGNDFHHQCIGQVKENVCPNCRALFSDQRQIIKQKSNYTISNRRSSHADPKKEGGIQWWGAFIILEIVNVFFTFGNSSEGQPFSVTLRFFVVISIFFLFLSPLVAWKWRRGG